MGGPTNMTPLNTSTTIRSDDTDSSSKLSSQTCPTGKKRRIALVCDFFYPNLGGVEMHLWSLAQCLHRLGHKVIIITHAYSAKKNGADQSNSNDHHRTGVRYLPGPIKVYYCPIVPFVANDTLPTFLVSFPLLRWIFIRERIDIVHSHQATSSLANESLVYAAELGIRSVYTDHSLFGFDDVASLILNQVLKSTLSTVGAAICVSHTCRENLILRASLDPSQVYAIPNAVDPSKFTPDPSCQSNNRIRIVVLSRLVYRKGVDLLKGIIPRICHIYPQVDFLIGGDGSKKLELVEMVEREQLQERITFLGAVPHTSVRSVLVRGHLFLNCSLTESFCIALLEAASCGLFAISTNVGGVPEVLPEDMIYLADPKVSCLVESLAKAIEEKVIQENITVKDGSCEHSGEEGETMYKLKHDPFEFHERVKSMYSWVIVAKKTVRVYEKVMELPRLTFLDRLERYRSVGKCVGLLICYISMLIHFWVKLVDWYQPRRLIDVVPDLSGNDDTRKQCNDELILIHDQVKED